MLNFTKTLLNGIQSFCRAEIAKAKRNPVFTGSFSQNRKKGSVVGKNSHAEGQGTTASGSRSHAEGWGTTAQRKSQHAQGEYNILDTEGTITTRGKYAHIVGNGTSASARSNAHTLDWDGVPWYQGRPQFGGNAQDDGSQTVMANGDKEIILTSSTEGSTKQFKITVDDSGTLTATEVTN